MELQQPANRNDILAPLAKTPSASYLRLQILAAIARYIDEHEFSPSIRDISGPLEISTSHCHHHLAALERQGYIVHPTGKARSMALTDAGRQRLELEQETEELCSTNP